MIPARGPQTKLKEIPGLSHYGDERTCPQVLRAKHLLTTGVFSTVLTTRNPGIPAIGILARLRRLSLGGVATSALFSSILPAADGPRMASISLGLLLGRLCGGSIYTTSKKLSNASVV